MLEVLLTNCYLIGVLDSGVYNILSVVTDSENWSANDVRPVLVPVASDTRAASAQPGPTW